MRRGGALTVDKFKDIGIDVLWGVEGLSGPSYDEAIRDCLYCL